MFGPGLSPGAEAAAATGAQQVLPRDDFAKAVAGYAAERRTVYTPLRPEVLGEASSTDPAALWRATRADPWDGRVSREEQFVDKLKAAGVGEIKDLDPVVDALRVIKSPAEIAVIRESTRLASLGILEAMKSAKPGMYEYELEAVADYVFKRHNAQGIAYGLLEIISRLDRIDITEYAIRPEVLRQALEQATSGLACIGAAVTQKNLCH